MELFFKLMPFLMQLIGIAEKAFFQPAMGQEKKQFVKDAAKTVVDGVQAVSTGGQAETWERLEEPVDRFIDASVELVFPKGSGSENMGRSNLE